MVKILRITWLDGDNNPAVQLPTGFGTVISDQCRFTKADSADAFGVDTLANQSILDVLVTIHRKGLVSLFRDCISKSVLRVVMRHASDC